MKGSSFHQQKLYQLSISRNFKKGNFTNSRGLVIALQEVLSKRCILEVVVGLGSVWGELHDFKV